VRDVTNVLQRNWIKMILSFYKTSCYNCYAVKLKTKYCIQKE